MNGEKTRSTRVVLYSITRDVLVEIMISAIKRMSGENLRTLK